MGLKWLCRWVVASRETDCRRRSVSETAVRDLIVLPNHGHLGMMVGKIEEPACGLNSNRISCVEAEEPNPRFAVVLDVGPNIELRKVRKPGYWRSEPVTNHHSKRDDANPGGTVERLKGQAIGNEVKKVGSGNRPVNKEQINPRLRPGPKPRRQRPRTVITSFKGGVHFFPYFKQRSMTDAFFNCREINRQIKSPLTHQRIARDSFHSTELGSSWLALCGSQLLERHLQIEWLLAQHDLPRTRSFGSSIQPGIDTTRPSSNCFFRRHWRVAAP